MNHAKKSLKYLLMKTKGKGPAKLNYKLAYAVKPLFPGMSSKIWNKPGASEGFITFTLACLICKNIDVYGFWPYTEDVNGNPVQHYYYLTMKYTKTKPQAIQSRENQILHNRHGRGFIGLTTGNCTS
ncbi:CMP-N-acetylneuraminate-poly-alpha-2,8-sialyltransferase-like [Saccoglossus kowalevskii]